MFAHEYEHIAEFETAVKRLKPTAIIGRLKEWLKIFENCHHTINNLVWKFEFRAGREIPLS